MVILFIVPHKENANTKIMSIVNIYYPANSISFRILNHLKR